MLTLQISNLAFVISVTHQASAVRTREQFPSDEAATKLFWLALRYITADRGRAANQ